jgi:hypothetical protein
MKTALRSALRFATLLAPIGCLLAMTALAVCAPPSKPVAKPTKINAEIKLAKLFVTGFLKPDRAAMVPLMDKQMKQALTSERIAQVRAQLISGLGPFKKQGKVRTGSIIGYDVVYIECTFEKGAIDAKVVFDKERKVSGFWTVLPGGI